MANFYYFKQPKLTKIKPFFEHLPFVSNRYTPLLSQVQTSSSKTKSLQKCTSFTKDSSKCLRKNARTQFLKKSQIIEKHESENMRNQNLKIFTNFIIKQLNNFNGLSVQNPQVLAKIVAKAQKQIHIEQKMCEKSKKVELFGKNNRKFQRKKNKNSFCSI